MTTLTMRMIKGDFVVTGPDVAPMKFKSRREARDWCKTHHPGSPITEVGPGGKRAPRKKPGVNPSRRRARTGGFSRSRSPAHRLTTLRPPRDSGRASRRDPRAGEAPT